MIAVWLAGGLLLIDPTNGKRAESACPLVVAETFLAGTEPGPCDEHRGFSAQVVNWWRRLRGWFAR